MLNFLCINNDFTFLVPQLMIIGYAYVTINIKNIYIPPTSHLPPTSYLLPPTSYHLPPPTSHLPPPTSHLPPPTSHLPPPTTHHPPPTSYLLPPTSYLLPPTSYLLPPTSYLLPPTSYLLPLYSSGKLLIPHHFFWAFFSRMTKAVTPKVGEFPTLIRQGCMCA